MGFENGSSRIPSASSALARLKPANLFTLRHLYPKNSWPFSFTSSSILEVQRKSRSSNPGAPIQELQSRSSNPGAPQPSGLSRSRGVEAIRPQNPGVSRALTRRKPSIQDTLGPKYGGGYPSPPHLWIRRSGQGPIRSKTRARLCWRDPDSYSPARETDSRKML
jgi:hypothetical protein